MCTCTCISLIEKGSYSCREPFDPHQILCTVYTLYECFLGIMYIFHQGIPRKHDINIVEIPRKCGTHMNMHTHAAMVTVLPW